MLKFPNSKQNHANAPPVYSAVKGNLQIRFANGITQSVEALFPPAEQAYLFPNVTVVATSTLILPLPRFAPRQNLGRC